ncbi:MAG: tetratricopeptide repeat protein, partial [Candidatus Thermoplasmatota archaeon]
RTIDFGFEIPELKHFYGREKELDKISEFMKSESKILALRGIAGIGKTYLVAKALEKYADWKIFWYRAHEFSTLQTFLKYLAEFLVTLRKSRLRAYLYSGRMDLNESLFILEEALQYDNVLLIFDDMHKMQKELVNFCAELFKILKRAEGVKAILAGRFIPSCFDRKDLVEGYVKELALEGLDREATAKLLEERGIKTIDKIYEFTKGHPLMLELVKSEETAWGDAYSFLNAEIYNKLEESEKTILGLASVFRAPFKAALFTENNLNTETVEGLVTKTLLQRSGEVYNAHDLIKSFIYNIITENDRINYHRSASEYYRSEEGELAALEAIWHSIKSLDEANALKILVANKDNFLTKGYLTELINVANGFKTTTSELLELKAQALFLHGDWNLAIDCYNKLLKHALEAKDNKTQAQVYCKLGEILTLRADYEKASDYLEKALATAESINEIPMVAYAKYHLGRISWLQGKPDRALEILNQALKLSTQKGLIQLEGKVSTDLGDAYYLRGELDKTISLFRKALRIARATNDSYEVARALHNIGGLFGVKKYYNKAIKWLEKCIKFSDKIGYVRMYGYGLVDAAENYISLGNLSRAKEYIDRAHNIFTRLNEQRMISAVYRAYGMLYRELGDFRKSI